MAIPKPLTGIYQTKKGWYYQMSFKCKTYRGGPYVCRAIALAHRISLRNEKNKILFAPYELCCPDCKEIVTLIPAKNGAKSFRCIPCREKRKKIRQVGIDKKRGVKYLGSYINSDVAGNYDFQDRQCLKCGRIFVSEGKFNRLCELCKKSNFYVSHSCVR